MKPKCMLCGEKFSLARAEIGYDTCLKCGDARAHKVNHCVVPMSKSNYIHVRDHQLLKQLNKYANI